MKPSALVLVALIASTTALSIASAQADDPPILFDSRQSFGGWYAMETSAWKVPDNVTYMDIYDVKVYLYARYWAWPNIACFAITTTGVALEVHPHGGFAGGGISLSGSGPSGSVPVSVVYTTGVETSQVNVYIMSLYPSQVFTCLTRWNVTEGGQFDLSVMTAAENSYSTPSPHIETAIWVPHALVKSPAPVISTKPLISTTTATFNVSDSFPGYDGDQEAPVQCWSFDFGDGTTLASNESIVTHAFPGAGMFAVEVTAHAPAIGWAASNYVDHGSSGVVIQVAPNTTCDSFVIMENYYPEGRIDYICGIGQGVSFGGHLKQGASMLHMFAFVADDGQPVEGVEVHFTILRPYGGTRNIGTAITNASGIAYAGWEHSTTLFPSTGVCGLVAECAGQQDTTYFTYGECLLMVGHTFDLYNINIDEQLLVDEGSIWGIIADPPPIDYRFDGWIINFFWKVPPPYNPIYVKVDFDLLIIASYIPTLHWDVNGDGYIGIDDIFTVAYHFGRDSSSPDWEPRCDITGDSYIGIDDIYQTAQHFGQEYQQ